jgi:hypothetical protein
MLAYGFTKKCQFRAKIDWNSVFLGHVPHIMVRLSITVSYMSFVGFEKNSNIRSKSIGAYDFTEITSLGAKTYWNFVFLSRDPHILDGSYIAVTYMSFFEFWKN